MENKDFHNSVVPAPYRSFSAVFDFSEILQEYGLSYRLVDFHWLTGEITLVQGWILHVSVVRWQIAELLNTLIPILKSYRASFKVVKDMDTAKNLLDGELGTAHIGKVITVYSESITDCVLLVQDLIKTTHTFKGPVVLTDIHLGGNVYTRYGAFQPVLMPDRFGKDSKCIYNHKGELVPDLASIPFQMPEGQEWPFSKLASPVIQKKRPILQGIYKPLFNLKSDVKGNVMKALYIKNILWVRKCVIKEGKMNMWADETGRDMADRLVWQKELHDQLAKAVPVPKILDLFYEGGDAYLAMEYVKGFSLYDYQLDLNKQCTVWHKWPTTKQLKIIDFLLQIINILTKLHEKGIVHRDVTPVNFLVGKKNKLILIDIELAYSIKERKPTPPFEFGTHGFMSPEQTEVKTPKKTEDIYALGATMITMLAGLPPDVFDKRDIKKLMRHLNFFIRNEEISCLIADCLNAVANRRPPLHVIFQKVLEYRAEINNGISVNKCELTMEFDQVRLKEIINRAIRGLVSYPTLMEKDLWVSKWQDVGTGPQKKGYSKSTGLFEGITGVLYFLGKAQKSGFDIQDCQKAYETGWKYIAKTCLARYKDLSPGLYGGGAGIAVAMTAGIQSGLLIDNDENRQTIHKCLKIPTCCPDIAYGVAGQGLAILHSREYIGEDLLTTMLANNIEMILTSQDAQGVWVKMKDNSGKYVPTANLDYGNTGITWFLQEYYEYYKDNQVQDAIIKSLNSSRRLVHIFELLIKKRGFRNIIASFQTRNGIIGVILNFIKAYAQWKIPLYQQFAERLLFQFPPCIVHEDFSEDVGLAGIGELYLEAARVFTTEEWKERASWIAAFFMSTIKNGENDSIYWLTNNSQLPTADLMVGNSGIIHFLIRFYGIEELSYRLAP